MLKSNWPKLQQLVKEEALEKIDLLFAQSGSAQSEEHAALLAALFALYREGHLALDLEQPLEKWIPHPELRKLVKEAIEKKPPDAPLPIFESSCVYLQRSWLIETEIAKHLRRLLKTTVETIPFQVPEQLNLEQRSAVEKACAHSISILTGGPGTGKTFTAAQIASAISSGKKQSRVILTAPTGKAVAQLEKGVSPHLKAAEIEAKTLHALLGIRTDQFQDEWRPPLFADLIIVDECSMIDASLFAMLLGRISSSARLVLIGDQHQLPPVEAGSVFSDLIASQCIPTTELSKSLRSDKQEILLLAQLVKEGRAEEVVEMLKVATPALAWISLENPEEIWRECKDRFCSFYDQQPKPATLLSQIQQFSLLSCIRKGVCGIDELNRYFYSQFFQESFNHSYWAIPIMITRNQSEIDLFNGDQGVLVKNKNQSEDYACFIDRKGGWRTIPALALPAFEYCYCLSVHKSQGSEYDEVYILSPEGAEAFGRELLYTALTRARKRAVLASAENILRKTIEKSSGKVSGIKRRLIES